MPNAKKIVRKSRKGAPAVTRAELEKAVTEWVAAGGVIKKLPTRHLTGAFRGTIVAGAYKKGGSGSGAS